MEFYLRSFRNLQQAIEETESASPDAEDGLNLGVVLEAWKDKLSHLLDIYRPRNRDASERLKGGHVESQKLDDAERDFVSDLSRLLDLDAVIAYKVMREFMTSKGLLGLDFRSELLTEVAEYYHETRLEAIDCVCELIHIAYPVPGGTSSIYQPHQQSEYIRAFVDKVFRSSSFMDRVERQFERISYGRRQHSIHALALSSDGTTLVTASYDETLLVWDADKGTHTRTLRGHKGEVLSVAISSTTVASGSSDGSVRLWNSSSGSQERCMEGHTRDVTCVSFIGPDRLISCSRDNTVRLWKVSDGSAIGTPFSMPAAAASSSSAIPQSYGEIKCCAVSSKADRVACGTSTGFIILLSTTTPSLELCAAPLRMPTGGSFIGSSLNGIAFAADGNSLWVASSDCNLHQVSIKDLVASSSPSTSPINATIMGSNTHPDMVTSVRVVSEKSQVITGCMDRIVRIYDTSSKSVMDIPESHSKGVLAVTASSSGSLIACSGSDGIVRVWSVTATSPALKATLKHTLAHDEEAKEKKPLNYFSNLWENADWVAEEQAALLKLIYLLRERFSSLRIPFGSRLLPAFSLPMPSPLVDGRWLEERDKADDLLGNGFCTRYLASSEPNFTMQGRRALIRARACAALVTLQSMNLQDLSSSYADIISTLCVPRHDRANGYEPFLGNIEPYVALHPSSPNSPDMSDSSITNNSASLIASPIFLAASLALLERAVASPNSAAPAEVDPKLLAMKEIGAYICLLLNIPLDGPSPLGAELDFSPSSPASFTSPSFAMLHSIIAESSVAFAFSDFHISDDDLILYKDTIQLFIRSLLLKIPEAKIACHMPQIRTVLAETLHKNPFAANRFMIEESRQLPFSTLISRPFYGFPCLNTRGYLHLLLEASCSPESAKAVLHLLTAYHTFSFRMLYSEFTAQFVPRFIYKHPCPIAKSISEDPFYSLVRMQWPAQINEVTRLAFGKLVALAPHLQLPIANPAYQFLLPKPYTADKTPHMKDLEACTLSGIDILDENDPESEVIVTFAFDPSVAPPPSSPVDYGHLQLLMLRAIKSFESFASGRVPDSEAANELDLFLRLLDQFLQTSAASHVSSPSSPSALPSPSDLLKAFNAALEAASSERTREKQRDKARRDAGETPFFDSPSIDLEFAERDGGIALLIARLLYASLQLLLSVIQRQIPAEQLQQSQFVSAAQQFVPQIVPTCLRLLQSIAKLQPSVICHLIHSFALLERVNEYMDTVECSSGKYEATNALLDLTSILISISPSRFCTAPDASSSSSSSFEARVSSTLKENAKQCLGSCLKHACSIFTRHALWKYSKTRDRWELSAKVLGIINSLLQRVAWSDRTDSLLFVPDALNLARPILDDFLQDSSLFNVLFDAAGLLSSNTGQSSDSLDPNTVSSVSAQALGLLDTLLVHALYVKLSAPTPADAAPRPMERCLFERCIGRTKIRFITAIFSYIDHDSADVRIYSCRILRSLCCLVSGPQAPSLIEYIDQGAEFIIHTLLRFVRSRNDPELRIALLQLISTAISHQRGLAEMFLADPFSQERGIFDIFSASKPDAGKASSSSSSSSPPATGDKRTQQALRELESLLGLTGAKKGGNAAPGTGLLFTILASTLRSLSEARPSAPSDIADDGWNRADTSVACEAGKLLETLFVHPEYLMYKQGIAQNEELWTVIYRLIISSSSLSLTSPSLASTPGQIYPRQPAHALQLLSSLLRVLAVHIFNIKVERYHHSALYEGGVTAGVGTFKKSVKLLTDILRALPFDTLFMQALDAAPVSADSWAAGTPSITRHSQLFEDTCVALSTLLSNFQLLKSADLVTVLDATFLSVNALQRRPDPFLYFFYIPFLERNTTTNNSNDNNDNASPADAEMQMATQCATQLQQAAGVVNQRLAVSDTRSLVLDALTELMCVLKLPTDKYQRITSAAAAAAIHPASPGGADQSPSRRGSLPPAPRSPSHPSSPSTPRKAPTTAGGLQPIPFSPGSRQTFELHEQYSMLFQDVQLKLVLEYAASALQHVPYTPDLATRSELPQSVVSSLEDYRLQCAHILSLLMTPFLQAEAKAPSSSGSSSSSSSSTLGDPSSSIGSLTALIIQALRSQLNDVDHTPKFVSLETRDAILNELLLALDELPAECMQRMSPDSARTLTDCLSSIVVAELANIVPNSVGDLPLFPSPVVVVVPGKTTILSSVSRNCLALLAAILPRHSTVFLRLRDIKSRRDLPRLLLSASAASRNDALIQVPEVVRFLAAYTLQEGHMFKESTRILPSSSSFSSLSLTPSEPLVSTLETVHYLARSSALSTFASPQQDPYQAYPVEISPHERSRRKRMERERGGLARSGPTTSEEPDGMQLQKRNPAHEAWVTAVQVVTQALAFSVFGRFDEMSEGASSSSSSSSASASSSMAMDNDSNPVLKFPSPALVDHYMSRVSAPLAAAAIEFLGTHRVRILQSLSAPWDPSINFPITLAELEELDATTCLIYHASRLRTYTCPTYIQDAAAVCLGQAVDVLNQRHHFSRTASKARPRRPTPRSADEIDLYARTSVDRLVVADIKTVPGGRGGGLGLSGGGSGDFSGRSPAGSARIGMTPPTARGFGPAAFGLTNISTGSKAIGGAGSNLRCPRARMPFNSQCFSLFFTSLCNLLAFARTVTQYSALEEALRQQASAVMDEDEDTLVHGPLHVFLPLEQPPPVTEDGVTSPSLVVAIYVVEVCAEALKAVGAEIQASSAESAPRTVHGAGAAGATVGATAAAHAGVGGVTAAGGIGGGLSAAAAVASGSLDPRVGLLWDVDRRREYLLVVRDSILRALNEAVLLFVAHVIYYQNLAEEQDRNPPLMLQSPASLSQGGRRMIIQPSSSSSARPMYGLPSASASIAASRVNTKALQDRISEMVNALQTVLKGFAKARGPGIAGALSGAVDMIPRELKEVTEFLELARTFISPPEKGSSSAAGGAHQDKSKKK